MRFHIITLFPEVIEPYMQTSIIGRAQKREVVTVAYYNPRDYTNDKHKTVDDKAYGGGPGMVMMAAPILKAAAVARGRKKKVKTILLSPHGKAFSNTHADKLIRNYEDIILIAGRYEGIDARVKKILKAEEVSVGPYTLAGGEVPAMTIVDAVTRRLPGVLGTAESIEEKRIASREVYTRPEVFKHKGRTYQVPKVLLSGDHKKIEGWRKKRRK